MDLSTLPRYPEPVARNPVSPESSLDPMPQRIKILWLCLKVMAIFATLFWLDFAVNRLQPKRPVPIERTPYEFHFVEYRYDHVGNTATRERVEELLGPPTEPIVISPELEEIIPDLEWSNRHFGLPADRVWVRWTDPRDPSKSVTILFAGDRVYHKMKTGFESGRD